MRKWYMPPLIASLIVIAVAAVTMIRIHAYRDNLNKPHEETARADLIARAERGETDLAEVVEKLGRDGVNEKMCHAAVAKNPENVKFCRESDLKTDDEFIAAINYGVAGGYWYRPCNWQARSSWSHGERPGDNVYLAYILKHPYEIEECPRDVLTERFLLSVIKGLDPDDLNNLKGARGFFTPAVAAALVTKGGPQLFVFLPEELVTREMVRKAVRKDPGLISYVPDRLYEDWMGEAAVRVDPRFLGNVPFKRRTKALCRLALETSNEAYEFVPQKHLVKEALQ